MWLSPHCFSIFFSSSSLQGAFSNCPPEILIPQIFFISLYVLSLCLCFTYKKNKTFYCSQELIFTGLGVISLPLRMHDLTWTSSLIWISPVYLQWLLSMKSLHPRAFLVETYLLKLVFFIPSFSKHFCWSTQW